MRKRRGRPKGSVKKKGAVIASRPKERLQALRGSLKDLEDIALHLQEMKGKQIWAKAMEDEYQMVLGDIAKTVREIRESTKTKNR